MHACWLDPDDPFKLGDWFFDWDGNYIRIYGAALH
jgi:hypothetical protein